MPATMRILGWKAQGLRCPDHKIDCTDSDGHPFPVTLIQMPNGTGKTTTLALLRAALSGAAIPWDKQKISEYRKKNGAIEDGYFEVRLLLNDRRATILMKFDFENGRVSYKTTYGTGRRDGFHPPADFQRFMDENFVKFYVFDGELAHKLLSRECTNAEEVVEYLFQINIFDKMLRKVSEYWDKQTTNVTATDERGFSRRQNRLSILRNRLDECKRKQRRLQADRDNLDVEFSKKEETYRKEIMKDDERDRKLREANTKLERLKGKVREGALDVLEKMRDPHALSSFFAESMLNFKDGLDDVQLPESAAREFFEDLADTDECVCGRTIDAKIAETIRLRAERYLGNEDVALLNSMKTVIKEAVGTSAEVAETDLHEKIESLETVVQEERNAQKSLDSLTRMLEQADPAIKNARDDIERLRSDIKDVDAKLEEFDSQDSNRRVEQTCGIDILKKWIDDAEKKLAEISHTLNEKARRDTLTDIIKNAHEKSRSGITSELCMEANTRISELMPYNRILIDRIERNLILDSQEGGSVGETLSIAYAFLATLFNRSNHELPFVVDSPAGPIDLAVRPRIGNLIPQLTKQFIAFTISSERDRFIDPLKQIAGQSRVQFITLFRKGPEELEREAHEKGKVQATDDGLNVTGENFFNVFQLEEEETA